MKKITVLFTVLLMLAASSVFAAVTPEFPAYLNGTNSADGTATKTTYLHAAAFGLNQTQAVGAVTDAITVMNSTKVGLAFNATQFDFKGFGNFTGRVSFGNASNATFAHSPEWSTNATFNTSLSGVTGLMATSRPINILTRSNSTQHVFNATTYFVPAGNYQVLFGLTNSSVNATSAPNSHIANYNRGHGLTMLAAYANGTFNGVASSTDTWDYYAYGTNRINAKPVVIVGQVQITANTGANNARARFTVVNGTKTDSTSAWISYNATGTTKNSLALASDKGMSLLSNATINVDRNLIVGSSIGNTGKNPNNLFVIMIKNGSNLSVNDVQGHAFRQVYVGTESAVKTLGNATGALAQFSLDNNLNISGDAAIFNATTKLAGMLTPVATSLDGYSAALANTNYFGLSQSNMTFSNTAGSAVGAFYGKQNAEKTFSVGIYEPIVTSGTGYALSVIVPAAASTGPIVQANAAYQANGTFTFGTNSFQLNSTGYTKTALTSRWTGLPSNFTPLTNVKGFNATVPVNQKQKFFTFQFAFDGVGDQVRNLRLYKLFPTTTKNVRAFNYAGSATPSVDGAWWISTAAGDGYLNSESFLSPSVTYYVNWVVRDNGSYDTKVTADRLINDPIVLGSVPTSSSSSSSGCVFNPAASFGLEWLLLMLAPMVAIVRSRFKK